MTEFSWDSAGNGEVSGSIGILRSGYVQRQRKNNKMIPYGNVMAIGDIVVVKSGRIERKEETEEPFGMEEV